MVGMCSYCGLAFCRECRKVWHGGSKCETVVQKWLEGSPEVRAELEKRCVACSLLFSRNFAIDRIYLYVFLLCSSFGSSLFQHALSEEWITKHTKPCPQCGTAIEKNLGCNHMTCKKCGYEWCWTCNGKYTSTHYQVSSCQQFGDDYFRELGIGREDYYNFFM